MGHAPRPSLGSRGSVLYEIGTFPEGAGAAARLASDRLPPAHGQQRFHRNAEAISRRVGEWVACRARHHPIDSGGRPFSIRAGSFGGRRTAGSSLGGGSGSRGSRHRRPRDRCPRNPDASVRFCTSATPGRRLGGRSALAPARAAAPRPRHVGRPEPLPSSGPAPVARGAGEAPATAARAVGPNGTPRARAPLPAR